MISLSGRKFNDKSYTFRTQDPPISNRDSFCSQAPVQQPPRLNFVKKPHDLEGYRRILSAIGLRKTW